MKEQDEGGVPRPSYECPASDPERNGTTKPSELGPRLVQLITGPPGFAGRRWRSCNGGTARHSNSTTRCNVDGKRRGASVLSTGRLLALPSMLHLILFCN